MLAQASVTESTMTKIITRTFILVLHPTIITTPMQQVRCLPTPIMARIRTIMGRRTPRVGHQAPICLTSMLQEQEGLQGATLPLT